MDSEAGRCSECQKCELCHGPLEDGAELRIVLFKKHRACLTCLAPPTGDHTLDEMLDLISLAPCDHDEVSRATDNFIRAHNGGTIPRECQRTDILRNP